MSNDKKPTVYTTANLEALKSSVPGERFFTIYYGHLPVCQLQHQAGGVQFFYIYLDSDLLKEMLDLFAEILNDHQTQEPDETTAEED